MTKQQLLELFDYKDGSLYWKQPRQHIQVGDKAGYDNGNGYIKISINGKLYFAHRLIFLMHHGYLPKLIDHINGNPSDNNIQNLREANKSKNAINSKLSVKNTSGSKNVYWNKSRNKWTVYMSLNQKQKFFGSFDDIDLAKLVANEARSKYYNLEAK